MVNLELVPDFSWKEITKDSTTEDEKETGAIFLDDPKNRTTAMTKDIYSLCFISCIKPTELVKLCP